jgi:hypothetical protein
MPPPRSYVCIISLKQLQGCVKSGKFFRERGGRYNDVSIRVHFLFQPTAWTSGLHGHSLMCIWLSALGKVKVNRLQDILEVKA